MELMPQADLQIRTIWALSFIVVKTAMVAKTTVAERTEARVDLMKLDLDVRSESPTIWRPMSPHILATVTHKGWQSDQTVRP